MRLALAAFGFQKVHITSVGFEVDRVVLPVEKFGADRVIIVTNVGEKGVYRKMIDEVKRRLKARSPRMPVLEAPLPIFDMSALIAGLGRIVRRETGAGNTVFINISVGTRLFGTAGYIVALMYGAVPFYAEVEKYRTKAEDFLDRKGRPLGISKGVKKVHVLPRPEIQFPSTDLVAALSLLEGLGGEAKEGHLIAALEDGGLMRDVRDGGRISKRARAYFMRHFGDPLKERDWIEARGSRRSATLCLTQKGEEVLHVFGPLLAEDLMPRPEPIADIEMEPPE